MLYQSSLQNLGDVPICVAIDRSGSTWGGTLGEEISVVQEICRLLSPRNENPLRLLPWCDETLDPIYLPKESTLMQNLTSSGGTNPSVLYSSAACLEALSACGLWFLLTDGQIEDRLVQDFALKTAELGFHGLACVVIIFGSTLSGSPATCDISVGIAAYAVAPDCLFLFHDIQTSRLYIMQAKGCFKELLPMSGSSYAQPVLSKYTTWAELPHISYEDLSRVRIAPPRKINADELALQNNLVVRMKDLYSGEVDQEIIGEMIKNEDNLKSIVMAEMTRGTGKELEAWLLSQQKPLPELTSDRPDVGGKAQRAVSELLTGMKNADTDTNIEDLRAVLRRAHEENLREFRDIVRAHSKQVKTVRTTNKKFGTATTHTQLMKPEGPGISRPKHKRTMTGFSCFSVAEDDKEDHKDVEDDADLEDDVDPQFAADPELVPDLDVNKDPQVAADHKLVPDLEVNEDSQVASDPKAAVYPTVVPRPKVDAHPKVVPDPQAAAGPEAVVDPEVDVLFLPRFKRCLGSPGTEFRGNCMLCCRESVLAILLKSAPNITTPNFPRQGSYSALAFPLAMSHFAETDIVSFFLCCDACALYLVRSCTSPLSETITGALGLVSVKENQAVWLDVLDVAFKGRFKISDLPTLFIAVLDRMIMENKARRSTPDIKLLYRNALQWAKRELSQIAEVPENLSSSFGRRPGLRHRALSLDTVISTRALLDPGQAVNTDISMLRYPLPGFVVIIRLMRDRGLTREQLQTHIFQRLVYHVTEVYFNALKHGGKQNEIDGMLCRSTLQLTHAQQQLADDIVTTVSIEDLITHKLLDPETLENFRFMDEFEDVEKRTGPAIAVYLHHLPVFANIFPSPIDCFNALKVSPSMKKVIMMPLAISKGLSADLILQMQG